jgi:hypothetical protein
LIPAELIDGLIQALFAPPFHLKIVALFHAPQVIDQYPPVHQESPAGLIAAEAVKQFDRPAASQSEQALDDGSVDHGHIE